MRIILKHALYILYFILLFYIVWLMPSEPKPDAAMNLYPFRTITLYMTAFTHGFAPLQVIIGNLIGNILLTVPIGILFSASLRHLGIFINLFLSFYIPVFIEFVQLLLHLGGYGTRSIDIDDILLNMLGIWIGYAGRLCFLRIWRK